MKKFYLGLFIFILIFTFIILKKGNQEKSLHTDNKSTNVIKEDLFIDYYEKAREKLHTMTLDEKIGSLFLVRYPKDNQVSIQKKYQFGGYIFFAKDFKNKSKDEVIKMIKDVQSVSKIPMLTAVDEEGGSVVRISSNKLLAKEKFKSPSELYKLGGLNLIYEDTQEKSKLLSSLGINLNLAPVVDIANPKDYIYERTLGENSIITSEYAKTVISSSKKGEVSYTLKHFPGYGSNLDTHSTISIDKRSISRINIGLLPFKEGIDEGAEAVLVNHNIIWAYDQENPASLSSKVHEILRKNLSFSEVIITDDISMQALKKVKNVNVKALLSDNDLIITSDYEESIKEIKEALEKKEIDEELINQHALKILSWKFYKNLL